MWPPVIFVSSPVTVCMQCKEDIREAVVALYEGLQVGHDELHRSVLASLQLRVQPLQALLQHREGH